jgi:hypothetical protein
MSQPASSFPHSLPPTQGPTQPNPRISSFRRIAAKPPSFIGGHPTQETITKRGASINHLAGGRQNEVNITTSDDPLESASIEEPKWPLRQDSVWQTEATEVSSDNDEDHDEDYDEDYDEEYDEDNNEDHDEREENQNLTQVSLFENKEVVYNFRYSAPQDTLNNESSLPVSKHTTLSQDRTIESGWNKKRLAVVLSPVSRHTPPVKQVSISREQQINNAFTGDFKFNLENFDFDTFLNTDAEATGFGFNVNDLGSPDGPLIPPTDSPVLGFRQLVDQALHQDRPIGTGMASFNFSEDKGVPHRYYGSEIEGQKLLRETFGGTDNNKESGRDESLAQYRKLMDRIDALEQENVLLKNWIDPKWNHRGRPFFQVVHRIEGDDRIFFNPPSWRRESLLAGIKYTLKGSSLSMRRKEYLERSGNLTFAVFKSYAAETLDGPAPAESRDFETPSLPNPKAETVLFASDEMRRAIQNYLSKHPNFEQLFPSFDVNKEIYSPYLFWYCTRASYESTLQIIPPHQRAMVKLFGEWVNANYETEYAHVDSQIERRVISCQSMKYLIRPGDPLVLQESGRHQAYQATSWADALPIHKDGKNKEDKRLLDNIWKVSVWSYEFDGVFYQKPTTLEIELDVTDPREEVELRSLKIAPLEYALPDVREKLEHRGKTYWACRKKKFISYSGEDNIDSMNNVSSPLDFLARFF